MDACGHARTYLLMFMCMCFVYANHFLIQARCDQVYEFVHACMHARMHVWMRTSKPATHALPSSKPLAGSHKKWEQKNAYAHKDAKQGAVSTTWVCDALCLPCSASNACSAGARICPGWSYCPHTQSRDQHQCTAIVSYLHELRRSPRAWRDGGHEKCHSCDSCKHSDDLRRKGFLFQWLPKW